MIQLDNMKQGSIKATVMQSKLWRDCHYGFKPFRSFEAEDTYIIF
jgi:hypothetical protein